MKKLLATALLSGFAMQANAALVAGDLAFTAFNADEDGWALVTFADIAANTTVYFTDNEWNGSAIGAGGAFNGGESFHQWNSGAATIAAGSVIRFSNIDNATTLAASQGTLSRATVSGSSNYGMSQSADTIYAYLGSSANQATTFLAAISSGLFSATEGQLANTGLVEGVSAVKLSSASDYAAYIGARDGLGNFDSYKALVANVANWDDKGDGSFAALVPNTTNFTVAAVPVPAAIWLFGSALAGFGFTFRRKNQA